MMRPLISEKTLDELRNRCDIVELVSSYFPLKRSGKNYSACCPFHEETKPSFMVNPERQIFKCFGCGKGGNVFHFIMQKEHVGFFDSVRMVADRVGYELPAATREVSEGKFKKRDLFEAMAFAVRCYQGFLNDEKVGRKGKEYFLGRGIKPEIIEELKLGYAPAGNMFHKAARDKGFGDELLESAGLLVDDGERKLRDKFYDRILFPIFSPEGRAIGFSGRVLGDREPKYMNSPETPLFSKSRVLYGVNFTRDEMIRQQHSIICEGHIDFIMLYQSGVRNAVATQGTAFTSQQARILKRYTPKVAFAFDSDSAGRKAVIRSLEPLLHAGLEVRVAEMPKGHDPDSFVRKTGADAFLRVISEAKDYFDFYYDYLTSEHDMNEQQGKLQIASEMLASIKKVPSAIVRDDLVQKLSQQMHISTEVLRAELRKIRGDYRPFSEKRQTEEKKLGAEEELLEYGLCFNESLEEIMKEVKPEDFQRSHCRKIAGLMYDMVEEKDELTFDDVLHRVQSEEEGSILTELMMRKTFSEHKDEVLTELIDSVLFNKWMARKEELKRLIDEADKENRSIDSDVIDEYYKLHSSLMRKSRVRFRTR